MKVEDILKKNKSFEKVLKRMEENLLKGRKKIPNYRTPVINYSLVLRVEIDIFGKSIQEM